MPGDLLDIAVYFADSDVDWDEEPLTTENTRQISSDDEEED